ncbi:MAG: SAF domain-containing protein [Acidimicrobiales bacterium]
MSWLLGARARARRLRRRPALRWLLVVGLALLTGLFTTRVVDSARSARARWGAGHAVVVMTGSVAAGDAIEVDDVEVVSLPAAVVPDDAMTEPPIGREAVTDLFPGEVLLAGRVAPGGRHGAAALLPPGTRALAVPSGPGTPPLRVGDTVDVLATFDPFLFDPSGERAAPLASAGGPVVSGALVVDVSEGATTVAVAAADAPQVAFALAQGAVTLALAG